MIVARLKDRPSGRPFLLGCPGGRSARTTYRHLARRAAAERLDLSALVIVMMDEYVIADPTGGFTVGQLPTRPIRAGGSVRRRSSASSTRP